MLTCVFIAGVAAFALCPHAYLLVFVCVYVCVGMFLRIRVCVGVFFCACVFTLSYNCKLWFGDDSVSGSRYCTSVVNSLSPRQGPLGEI